LPRLRLNPERYFIDYRSIRVLLRNCNLPMYCAEILLRPPQLPTIIPNSGETTMWKTAALGAATLVVAGSMFAYAQQQPVGPGFGGWHHQGDGMHRRHLSTQDMNAFADARIAALHAGLELNADQEKNWPAFEHALRELSKMRIDRITARRQQAMNQQPSNQQPSANPIERLQKRADAMTTRGTALKHLADAAAPLYQSLDDAQKQRFTMLARVMRRHHGSRHAMWRGHGGMRWQGGMRGEFRGDGQHGFGGPGQHDQRRPKDDDGSDYRGPL
jgi:zinc resistance-associated protein